MKPTRYVPIVGMAIAQLGSTQTVDFFYTDTLDLCQISGASMQANEQTTHGGVCAYRSDTARVYACPAPDPTCWTWYEECSSSNAGQTVCNRDGSVWCCNAVAGETCTTTQGQINVCISNFTSPNSGVSVDQANQVYLSALGISNVTATSQTVDPTPFSTRSLASTAAPSSSSSTPTSITTSMASSTTRSTSSSTSINAVGASSTSNPAVSSSSNGTGLSGGAIAGIVVGVILGLAILAGLFFILGRRRRNNSRKDVVPNEMAGTGPEPNAYVASNEKREYDNFHKLQAPASELGSEGSGVVEMPGREVPHGQPMRHEMP